MTKPKKCEACGKQPAAYYVDSWVENQPPRKLCCVCVDTMISKIGQFIKEELNIREITNPNSWGFESTKKEKP